MSKSSFSPVRVDKRNIQAAANTLSKAFASYPLLTYYYPGRIQREKITYYFVSSSIYMGIKYGEVYSTSTNMEGIAIWLPPGKYPVSNFQMIKSVPLRILIGLGREGGGKMKGIGDYIGGMHKRLAPFPHWFLDTLGIDPVYQGRGFASRLVVPMLCEIEKAGLPCYLDTMDEKNARIYEHFGFKILEESTYPASSLNIWAMLKTT